MHAVHNTHHAARRPLGSRPAHRLQAATSKQQQLLPPRVGMWKKQAAMLNLHSL
jgi:hypothetical protein